MGFVDNKNLIKGSLTELGYKKLLEGTFNPKFIILSDDGIDYSLIDTTNTSDPYYKFRNYPIIEPSTVEEGYKYRLITLPEGFTRLPVITTNIDSLNINYGNYSDLIIEIKNFFETGYFIRSSNKFICMPAADKINAIENVGVVRLYTGQSRMSGGDCTIQIEGIETGVIKNIAVSVAGGSNDYALSQIDISSVYKSVPKVKINQVKPTAIADIEPDVPIVDFGDPTRDQPSDRPTFDGGNPTSGGGSAGSGTSSGGGGVIENSSDNGTSSGGGALNEPIIPPDITTFVPTINKPGLLSD